MTGIGLVLASAVIVEGLIEYIKHMQEEPTLVLSLIVGILVAFLFQAELFNALGFQIYWAVDRALTGLVISRGANYVNDLISRINGDVARDIRE